LSQQAGLYKFLQTVKVGAEGGDCGICPVLLHRNRDWGLELNLFEVEKNLKSMDTSFRSSRGREVVRAGVLIAVAVMLVLVPRVALAHAVLIQSTPAINATVAGPEVAVSMKFSLRVDGARSTLLLSTSDGTSKPLAIDRQSSPDTLTTRATNLSPGSYAIHWQVLATDGHVTRGEIPFHVK